VMIPVNMGRFSQGMGPVPGRQVEKPA